MKKNWKKILAVLAAGVLAAGCGRKAHVEKAVDEPEEPVEEVTVEPTEEAEEAEIPDEEELLANYTTVEGLRLEKKSRIAVVARDVDIAYWKTVKAGIEQAVADLNEYLGYKGDDQITYTFEGPKSSDGVDQQVNILDAVISENPSVLCLAVLDMNSCEAQLEAAEEDGIPVVVLDSGVTSEDLVYSVVATDNEAAGAEAAKHLCEAIGEEGQVAVLSHLQVSENSEARIHGFEEEIRTNHPQVQLVATNYAPAAETDPSVEEQVGKVLEDYPDLKGYFCTNEVMSENMLGILDKHPDRQILMAGFDLGETQKKAIRDGREIGTICQNPYGMGYATVVAGVRAALDMDNDSFINSGFQWIDKDNIDKEENQKYLYD